MLPAPTSADDQVTLAAFLEKIGTDAPLATQIQDAFMNPQGDGTVFAKDAPLQMFLSHLCTMYRGDCASIMVFKVPSYKTELIRSWMMDNNADPKIHAALFKTMVQAGVTDEDLQKALAVFGNERYATLESAETRLDASGEISQITHLWLSDLSDTVENSHIAIYIAAIQRLPQVPKKITHIDNPESFYPTPHIETYYDESLTQQIVALSTKGATGNFISDEVTTATQEVLAAYYEKTLPQLLGELQLHIDTEVVQPMIQLGAASADTTPTQTTTLLSRMEHVKTALSTLRAKPTIAYQTANTTSYLQKMLDARSPAQKLLDEKIADLDSQIKALERQAKRGTNRTGLFSGTFGTY